MTTKQTNNRPTPNARPSVHKQFQSFVRKPIAIVLSVLMILTSLSGLGIAFTASAGPTDPVTVLMTVPEKADTFGLDGIDAPDLAVDLNITVNQSNVTGFTVEIPVETAPNGNAYYSYDATHNPSTGWPTDFVDSMTYGGGKVTVKLKDNIAQGTNKNVKVFFKFNQSFWRKVLPGTVLWDTVNAAVKVTSPAYTEALESAQVKTSAEDQRNLSVQKMNPTTNQVPADSVVTVRVRAVNTGYHMIDYNSAIPPVATWYFPAGTEVVFLPAGMTQGTAGDGRVTMTQTLPTDSSSWENFHFNNNPADNGYGGYYLRDPQVVFPQNVGTQYTVTGEFSYALAGQATATVQKTISTDYTIVAAKTWDLYTEQLDYNHRGSSPQSNCNIRPNDSEGVTYMYPMGYYLYGNYGATRNQGVGAVNGIKWVGKQPAGSPKINYASIEIVADKERTSTPRSRYQYWFVVENAQTSATRTTTPVTPVATYVVSLTLPTLGANEYISEVHVQPMGTNGTSTGVLPPKNSMAVRYTIKTWDGAKWPDGTAMPFKTELRAPWTFTYNDESGVLQTFNSAGVPHQYNDYGTSSVTQMLNVDPQGNALKPGQTVNFEIQASNSSNYSTTDWMKPVVFVKTLPNLKYVSNGNLFSGVNASSLTNNEGTVVAETIHEGSDYNLYKFSYTGTYKVPHDSIETRFRIPVTFRVAPGTPIGTYQIIQSAETSDNVAALTEGGYIYNRFSNVTWSAFAVVNGIGQRTTTFASPLDNFPAGDTKAAYELGTNDHIHFSGASGSYTVVPDLKLTASNSILGNADIPSGVFHGTERPGKIGIGGDGKINVIVKNDSNVNVSDFVIYDIVPRIGSKAMLEDAAVPTAWNPTFAGLTAKVYDANDDEVTLATAPVLYYSTVGNPSIPEIGRTFAGTQAPGWSTTPPADITTVRSFYVDFGGNKIEPGQYVKIEVSFRIPSGAVVPIGVLAYNAFAYTGNYYNGAGVVAPVEIQEPKPYGALEAVPASLTGVVTDEETGDPIPGAVVTVKDPAGNVIGTDTTDEDGNYDIPNIPENSVVDIDIKKPGYKDKTVDDVTVHEGTPVDVELTPLFTVTYHNNGGTGTPPVDTKTYPKGTSVDIVNPDASGLSKPNYEQTGWSTTPYDGTTPQTPVSDPMTMPAGDVDLYPMWSPITHTITYHNNGGTGTPPVDNGAYAPGVSVDIVNPNASGLSKPNYVQTGWSTTPYDGTTTQPPVADPMTMPNADVDLYPIWSPITYTVTYHNNGGTGTPPTDTARYAPGANVDIVNPGVSGVTKPGHTQTGWATTPGGTTPVADPMTMPGNNVNLYPIWTPNNHNIIYHNDGGTGAPPVDSIPHPYGSSVDIVDPEDTDIVKPGYEQTGWAITPGGTTPVSDPLTMPDNDVHLYPIWNPINYHVTYNPNGATAGTVPVDLAGHPTDSSVTVMDNEGNLAKAGQTFAGWNTRADGNGTAYGASDTFRMPPNDVVLYAQWAGANGPFTLTYDGNGATSGAAPAAPASVMGGATVTVLGKGTFDRAGYSFTGWNTKADGTGTAYTQGNTFPMPGHNTTLYAQWTPLPGSVTYHGNGNTAGTVPAKQTGNYGDTVGAKGNTGNLDRTGYEFDGWNTKADGTGTKVSPNDPVQMNGNVDLYAQWKIKQVDIRYDGNGNTGGTAPGTDTVNYNTPADVKEPGNLAKDGSTFDGWNTKPDGTGTHYAPDDTITPTEDTTLYAQWKPAAVSYEVIYDKNGADTGTAPATRNHDAGSTVTVSDNSGNLVKTGMVFDGWNTKADGTGTKYAAGSTFTMPSADVTLYAQWKDATADPNAPEFVKAPTNEKVKLGESVDYTIKNFGNIYGTKISALEVVDTPPIGLDFVSGKMPAFSNGSGVKYIIQYKTNKNSSGRTLAANVDASKTYNFNAPTLASGEYMTELSVSFSDVPANFAKGDTIVYTFNVNGNSSSKQLVNKAGVGYTLKDGDDPNKTDSPENPVDVDDGKGPSDDDNGKGKSDDDDNNIPVTGNPITYLSLLGLLASGALLTLSIAANRKRKGNTRKMSR